MKKTTLFALLAGMMLAGCSSDQFEEESEMVNGQSSMVNGVNVTLHFTRFQIEQQSMTRATDVSEYVTHLDIWIYESGSEIGAYHQATSSEGFGSLSLTLNCTKSYTIYAVAHKANGAATLSDGVISFPDDKVTHSFFYSDTFTPTENMQKVCSMNRIVAQFKFTTTDAIPAYVKQMRFTVSGVYNKWNVTSGAYNQLDRVSTINVTSTKPDGTITCNVYAIVTDANTMHNILVESLDETEQVRESHLFENVPLRNGYITNATGNFFTDAPSSFSFVADEWQTNTDYAF